MNSEERDELAAKRAEEYAPRPTGGSFMAGMTGASLAIIADMAASAFYGWRILDHLWLAALLAVAGFLVGFIGYKRLAAISRRARRTERELIDRGEDGSLDRGGQ